MTNKLSVITAALAASMGSSAAFADLSGNVGVVSDYYFRGVQQTASASANGGVDYEDKSGIYAGVWAADVEGQSAKQGIEIDVYAGFSGEAGDMGYSIGITHYGYTGEFDTSYDEVNLGGSYGDFGVDVAVGSHEGGVGTPDDDYSFVALSYGSGPFSATYGTFGGDWGGAYLEVGMTTEIGGADAGISVINGDPDDSFTGTGTNTTDGTALVFSISKGFDL